MQGLKETEGYCESVRVWTCPCPRREFDDIIQGNGRKEGIAGCTSMAQKMA
jgi:hypothetical protein